jgi:hypothetical protein
MGRISVAFRAFFAALFRAGMADELRAVLDGRALPKVTGDEKGPPGESARRTVVILEPPPKRSEAITLLATLQREARLVDLIQQPLGQFSDEQIGSAARNVLGDSASVLARLFALQPIYREEEETAVEVPKGYDPARHKLSGQIAGAGPFRGKLVHKGWQATHCTLPAWTGSKEAALVIAPAEVEV